MSEAMLDLDKLSREDKARIYEEFRTADSERKRLRRESELAERERHKIDAMISNTRRRVDRLREELKEREEEIAPAREAIAVPEPVESDFSCHRDWYNAHGQWFQLKHSAEEFVASKVGRIEHLKRAITEGDEKLKGLEKRRATLGPGF